MRVEQTNKLWHHRSGCFGIPRDRAMEHDGALNSLVCATVAYLFHHGTKRPHRLRHKAANKAGGGPFYVLTPDVAPGMHEVIQGRYAPGWSPGRYAEGPLPLIYSVVSVGNPSDAQRHTGPGATPFLSPLLPVSGPLRSPSDTLAGLASRRGNILKLGF